MRENLRPWVPALFCAFLGLITIVGNLSLAFATGAPAAMGLDVVFYCFLPMCFFFVGDSLIQLRRENRELRARLDDLAAGPGGEKRAA